MGYNVALEIFTMSSPCQKRHFPGGTWEGLEEEPIFEIINLKLNKKVFINLEIPLLNLIQQPLLGPQALREEVIVK